MTKVLTKMSEEDRKALSPLRRKAVQLLEDNVPAAGLTSDQPDFKKLTGYNTADLKIAWTTNPGLTTCNAFGGRYALLMGAKAGSWLSRGLLQLDWCDRDVKGSWKDWHSGEAPQPGDIFCKPYTFPDGTVQKFGHVGVIYQWHDTIFYDVVQSGQGSSKMGLDSMKWGLDYMFRPFDFTGWCDIEVYFK